VLGSKQLQPSVQTIFPPPNTGALRASLRTHGRLTSTFVGAFCVCGANLWGPKGRSRSPKLRWVERYSRTARSFTGKKTSDGTVTPPNWPFGVPNRMGRLSWHAGPRIPIEWSRVVGTIEHSGDTVFFCDNSIFDDETPSEVFDALLDAPGRLMLTPRVYLELRPWLVKRPTHQLIKAASGTVKGFDLRPEPEPGAPWFRAFDYYMALLATRRLTMRVAERIFEAEHGRPPEESDKGTVAGILQKNLGERGHLIASKPGGRFTDEALVVLAVEHALSTGRETIVLTKDADVEEQFFKLLWLIETHYRGMLLADRFSKDPITFDTRPFPPEFLSDPACPFEPDQAVMIERDAHMRDILPEHPHYVGLYCWNLGALFSEMAFVAEREMHRLITVKDLTQGRSTNLLGPCNLHASLDPLPIDQKSDCAAIVIDRRVPISNRGATAARLDLLQAHHSHERHATLVAPISSH
jgi:hypothetical protein